MKKIYIAYGANTNREAMKRRCPKAEIIGTGYGFIDGYKFKFNNVADIVRTTDEEKRSKKFFDAPAIAWRITPECEESLDRFEGFPSLYRKIDVNFTPAGEENSWKGFAYKMNYEGFHTPSPSYVNTIRVGLKDFFHPLYWETIDHSIDSAIVKSFRMEERGAPFTSRRTISSMRNTVGGSQWR